MKVYIGPYKNWIGPYQIADKVFFWLPKYPEEENEKRWDYKLHDRFGDWLASTWVSKVCAWFDKRKKRKINVRIDHYDLWSMDHTLSYIILPMLIKLKEIKHGSPFIDDEDVPENLRSTNSPPKKNEWDTDDFFHDRWEWVLDEMIWAFEHKVDEDWEDPYHAKQDYDGLRSQRSRMKNGFRLFGKYYEGLWD